MKVYNFKRIANDGKRIFGQIYHNGVPTNLHFLENYQLRVKSGEYSAKRDEEGKYVGYWELQNVTGRTEIIFGHSANFFHQLLGCAALGKEWGILNDELAILRSKEAVNEWHIMTKAENEIKIIIEEPKDGVWVA